MRRTSQVLRGIVALVSMIAVVVGVPAALVEFVGWPLPTEMPDLGELQRAASMGVTEATVIKTLAVVVWLAWSQVALGIAAECMALIRRRPARSWGVMLPGAQALASKLVAGTLLVLTVVGPKNEAMARPLESVIGQVEPSQPPLTPVELEVGDAPVAAETPAAAVVSVGERGSWWQLAEDHLGDGLRWREVRDLNVGREVAPGVQLTAQTEQLEPGWSLLVPDSGGISGRAVEWSAGPVDAGPETHVVEAGEHFWEIAEDTLMDAWDRAPTDQETASYWRDLIEGNRDRLAPPHDPDLIHPEQVFVLPELPEDHDQDESVDEGVETSTGQVGAAGTPTEEPAGGVPSEVLEREAVTWTGKEESPGTGGVEGWSSALADSDPGRVSSQEDDARTVWGTPVGLTGGVAATGILGAGLVGLLRRRRRAAVQRHVAGLRLPTPSTEAQRTEARLAAAAPTPERLTDLAALLASIPSGVLPVLVTTADDGTVTLLFAEDDKLPAPPEPWQLAHDGDAGPVGWEARIGSRGIVRSIGLPLLVTLGRAGAKTVLSNVGAMQTLAVRGEDADVLTCLRRFALEAAVSPISGPLEVVVDDERLMAEVPGMSMAEDLDAAIAAAAGEQAAGVVEEDRTLRLLISTTRPPNVPRELRSVLGLATAAGAADTAWVLEADGGDMRLHLPDGAVLDLEAPDVDLAHVDESLEEAEPIGADPVAMGPPGETMETVENQPAPADSPGARTGPWCEIQVLGRVRVLLGGEELRLSSQQRELLAYLACHRGAEAEQIEDAIWAGQADDTGQRLRTALTKLRSTLGDGPDGEPLVPRRTGPGQGIRLSAHVGTDLDRALEVVSNAWSLVGEERLSAFNAALARVRGAPFENLPATWTTAPTHTAIVQLQEAALQLSRALRGSGRLNEAETEVRQGLRLCDPTETLYREWIEIEAARGRPDRIRALESRLHDLLVEDADDPEHLPPAMQGGQGQLSALG